MDTEHARALLTRERERIEAALGRAEPAADADDGSADAPEPSELVQAGVDEAAAESLRDELTAIERAEQRLADGTYGLSVVSGEPIPDARLEAVPWAERTVAEQEQLG